MIGHCVKGKHVSVAVTLRFANGAWHNTAWTTPLALHRALHKALGWARDDASKHGVKGRSKIVGISVDAKILDGDFDDEDVE